MLFRDKTPAEIGKDHRKSDDSVRFKCIGGPLHECVVRLWPPYDYLAFPGNEDTYHVYELTAPPASARSKKWVLIHSEQASEEYTASKKEASR